MSVIGIAIVLATLPMLAEILVLSVAALLPAPERSYEYSGAGLAPITVLIPAHNEEALIGRCIRSILATASSGTDVLVVAHNCTDATAMRARAAGATALVVNDPGQTGKGCALLHGFRAALAGPSHGFLVIDADSVVEPGLLQRVRRRLSTGAAALQCRYELFCSPDRPRAGLTSLAFHAFNIIRPRGRDRLGLSAGVFGNGFALHREVLKRVPYDAHSIVEDLEYHLMLVCAKIRVEFVESAAVRGEMPVTSEGARAQRARWEGGRLRVMKRWVPRLLSGILRGQFRLMEPLLDLLTLPIASGVVLLLIAACLPLPWLKLYALTAFTVLLFHLTAAALSGPGVWGSMKALLNVPGYILWKLWILPDILRTSRANAAWIRTDRESPATDR
jgi:cellulose synthase/poly-beta-1,6-N-acetylglucosamine synthase-like glycosyltransferase